MKAARIIRNGYENSPESLRRRQGRLAIPRRNRICGAAQNPFSYVFRSLVRLRHLRNLKSFLTQLAQSHDHIVFLLVTSNPQVNLVSRLLLAQPALESSRRIAIIPAHNFVSRSQTTCRCRAIYIDAPDRPRTIGFVFNEKSKHRPDRFLGV
jgi:hypothetical protein